MENRKGIWMREDLTRGLRDLRNGIFYLLGMVEVLLTFRLAFRFLGADPASRFVSFVYTTSSVFAAPFEIWVKETGRGFGTSLDVPALAAMAGYWILALGIGKILELGMRK